MSKERTRFVNCYQCGVRLQAKEAVRKAKSEAGEELLFCPKCVKKQFRQRVKLIKRTLEKIWPQV